MTAPTRNAPSDADCRAPLASMQPEDPVHGAQFGRLNQFGVHDGDRKQWALELFLPEGEEVLQRREIRKQIVVLPDVSLQQPGTIRTAINDFRCCQSVAKTCFLKSMETVSFSTMPASSPTWKSNA